MPVTLNAPIMKPANIKASQGESQAAKASPANGDFQKIFAKQVNKQVDKPSHVEKPNQVDKPSHVEKPNQVDKPSHVEKPSQVEERQPALQDAGADGNTLVKAEGTQNTLERLQPKTQSLQEAASKLEHGDKKKGVHHRKSDVKDLADSAKATPDLQVTTDSDLKPSADISDVAGDKKLKKTAEQTEIKAEDAKPQLLSSLLTIAAPQQTAAKTSGVQAAEVPEDADANSLLDIVQNSQHKKSGKQDTLLAQRTEKITDKGAVADSEANIASSKVSEGKFSDSSLDNIQQQASFNQALEQKLAAQPGVNNVQAPATIAATAIINPVVAAEQTQVTARLGTDKWNAEVGQKVMWMVGAEQQSATLTLNPPDLGPVQVVIQVHNDQADTTFISQNPEVRQALQDGLSVLRDMMASNGVQLGEANIHSHEQAQHQGQQQAKHGQGNGPSTAETFSAPASAVQTYVSNGLVDTFA